MEATIGMRTASATIASMLSILDHQPSGAGSLTSVARDRHAAREPEMEFWPDRGMDSLIPV
jgi:hypothetical protein